MNHDMIAAVLEKTRQDSFLVAADENESLVSQKGPGNIVSKRRGK